MFTIVSEKKKSHTRMSKDRAVRVREIIIFFIETEWILVGLFSVNVLTVEFQMTEQFVISTHIKLFT